MLALRPTCENCNRDLAPNSTEAMICSFECTFCKKCVAEVLRDVCPNCGGNFCARPIRPATRWKGNAFLGAHPASTRILHHPVDEVSHAYLIEKVGALPPEKR